MASATGPKDNGELTARNIIEHMKEVKFEINTHWTLFLRLLGSLSDSVQRLDHSGSINGDLELLLEDGLEELIRHDQSISWDKVKQAMADLREQHHAAIIVRLYKQSLLEELNELRTLHILLVKLEAERFSVGGVCNPDSINNNNPSPERVLEVIVSSVKEDPDKLWKLIAIVRINCDNFRSLSDVINQLDRECRRCGFKQPSESPIEPSKDPEIPLSPKLENDFDSIILEYTRMIRKIVKLVIETLHRSTDDNLTKDLREYLIETGICDSEMKESASTEEMIKSFIIKNNSVLKTAHARNLVDEFNITGGIEEVKKFEDHRQIVCDKIKTNELIKRRLYPHVDNTDCEKITFTVRWEVKDTYLEDIEKLLWIAFEELGCEIHVKRLEKGNSIVITCYAPEALMGLLIYKAQKNLLLLKEKGVMSLRIGYCILLDHKRKYEINEPVPKEKHSSIQELREEQENLRARIKEIEITIEDHEKDSEPVKPDKEEHELKPYHQESLIEKVGKEEELQEEYEMKLYKSEEAPIIAFAEGVSNIESQSTIQKLLDEREQELATVKKINSNTYQLIDRLQDEKKNMAEELLKLKDQKRSAELEIDKLKEETASKDPEDNKPKIESSVGRIPTLLFHSKVHYPPVDIVMNKFTERKRNKEYWWSPSFYSHPGGYKLCVVIIASGQDTGKGTHLSLNAHLMSGDYDHRLSWPFKGEVKLQLLNQRADHSHVDATIKFDESASGEAVGRVLAGLKSSSGTAAFRGVGVERLISHKDLMNSQHDKGTDYLKDDAVFVRILEVVMYDQGPTAIVPSRIITDPPEATAITPIAEFRVPNFSKLRAKNGKWESEGFYTHPNGYKFLLAVHPNGKGDFKGKSVSAYTHLMKGEYDIVNKLKFPFRGVITVQLVNQREDKNHVENLIRYNEETDPTGFRGARVTPNSLANRIAGRSYGGWGFPNFVRHEYLTYNRQENTQYLTDDDVLVFRITNVKLQ